MKLIVVKNPNVARRFAEALNVLKREADYFKGEEFYITWVLDLGRDKAWAFVPSCFSKENHIKNILSSFYLFEGIILAVSSFEELKLFEGLYKNVNPKHPIQIIQFNSLTRKSIQKGLDNLIEISDFEGILKNEKVNDNKLDNYTKTKTEKVNQSKNYQIQLTFAKDFLNLKAYSEQIFPDEQMAKEALSSILRKGNLLVNEALYERQTQKPPLLYNLMELQNDCKMSFGFTKDETIKLTESLYEKGFVTYPNTKIQTIMKENWEEINGIVRALKMRPSMDLYINEVRLGNFSRRIVNNNNSLKFEGIYPTGIIPSALNLKENKVYDFIALRLLESLSEPCIMNLMDVKLNALNHIFRLQAFHLVEAGWRGFKDSFFQEHIEIYPHLPELKKDESFHIVASKILQL